MGIMSFAKFLSFSFINLKNKIFALAIEFACFVMYVAICKPDF
jgi:hypothetical protein